MNSALYPFATVFTALFGIFGIDADEQTILAIITGAIAVFTGVLSIVNANKSE